MECKYKPIERFGLYVMVSWILLFGSCNARIEHQEVLDKLYHIETLLKVTDHKTD